MPLASSGTSQREHRKTTRRERTSRTPRPASQVRLHTPIAWLHTLTIPSSPGVFLNYDISPILIVHDEARQSFAHFLTSCVFPVVWVMNEMLTGAAAATQDVCDCGRGADGRVAHRQRALQRDPRAEASWPRGASGILQREAHVIRVVVVVCMLCIAFGRTTWARRATHYTALTASQTRRLVTCVRRWIGVKSYVR